LLWVGRSVHRTFAAHSRACRWRQSLVRCATTHCLCGTLRRSPQYVFTDLHGSSRRDDCHSQQKLGSPDLHDEAPFVVACPLIFDCGGLVLSRRRRTPVRAAPSIQQHLCHCIAFARRPGRRPSEASSRDVWHAAGCLRTIAAGQHLRGWVTLPKAVWGQARAAEACMRYRSAPTVRTPASPARAHVMRH
jgi:hypothetical protein